MFPRNENRNRKPTSHSIIYQQFYGSQWLWYARWPTTHHSRCSGSGWFECRLRLKSMTYHLIVFINLKFVIFINFIFWLCSHSSCLGSECKIQWMPIRVMHVSFRGNRNECVPSMNHFMKSDCAYLHICRGNYYFHSHINRQPAFARAPLSRIISYAKKKSTESGNLL